jgi:hypothetical protein
MHRWLRTELPAVIRVEDRDGVVRHRGPHRLKLVQRLAELVVRPLVYVRTYERTRKRSFLKFSYVCSEPVLVRSN